MTHADALQILTENRKLREENAQLKFDVHHLEVMLRLKQLSMFAPSSERHVASPLFPGSLATSVPESIDDDVEIAGHRRRKKKRPAIPENAPREIVKHDVPEGERFCPVHGIDLTRGDDRKSQQVEWIPAKIKVIEHVCATYCCPICDKTVKIAEAPSSPIPGSIATAGLLAQIATAKFADGLPLYRQEGILARAGFQITRTTMATWMGRLADMLVPLCNLFNDVILQSPVIFVDETHLQVLKVPGKAATSKSYLWVRVGGLVGRKIVLFHFDPSRSSDVPVALLEGYKGYMTTDDYSGYNRVAQMAGIRRLQCWMHIRRYFKNALKALGKHGKGGLADQGLAKIRKLYVIERDCHDFSPEDRHRHRIEHATPLLDDFYNWLEGSIGDVPPKSATAKAIKHALDVWPYLTIYLENGHLLMDNSPAENAIRPVAIGRKNWMFCDTVTGAETTATLYSVIETAKANGLDPFVYLKHVIERLTTAETLADVEALLPWNIVKSQIPTAVEVQNTANF